MNKKRIMGFSICLITILFTSCAKDNSLKLSDQNPDLVGTTVIPEVPVTKDYVVGAFYYNFTSWNTRVTKVPVALPYFSDNTGTGTAIWKGVPTNVMQQHILQANAGKLDFFIFSFRSLMDVNNNKSDTSLIKSFLLAPNANDMKFAISYELSTATLGGISTTTALETKQTQLKGFLKDFISIGRFFKYSNYMKVGDKYLVYIHNAHQLYANDNAALYKRMRDTVELTYGVKLYIVASQPNNSTSIGTPPARFISRFQNGVDAVWLDRPLRSLSNSLGWSIYWQYCPWANTYFKYCKDYYKNYNINYQPSLMPAYDPRINNATSTNPFFGRADTASFFKKMCNVAKLNVDSTRIVVIDSWNNWIEDSQLEPSLSDSTLYLSTLRKEFKVN